MRSICTDKSKLVKRKGGPVDELYDLARDPEEQHNLIDEPASAELRASLATTLQQFFDRYAVPEFDLWKSGTSKAPLLETPKKARTR